MRQKAFMLVENKDYDNLEELNDLLSEGWKVVSQQPMGGNVNNLGPSHCVIYQFRSLIILEKGV